MMKNLVIYLYILHKHFGGVLLSVGDKCDMITLCIPTQRVPLGGANEAYTVMPSASSPIIMEHIISMVLIYLVHQRVKRFYSPKQDPVVP